MELPLAIAAITALAGLVQGLSGFGSALVAVPLMSLLLPMEQVVPLMVLLGIGMSSLNLLHLRRSLSLKPVLPLIGGYLLGTPLGLYFLIDAPEVWVKLTLGLFLSGYAALSLAGRTLQPAWLRHHPIGIGTGSGALGAAFSTNGPPVILHVAAQQWSADQQKAALSLFFVAAGLITASAHGISGLLNLKVAEQALMALPMLIAGTWLGITLYRRLDDHNYRRLTFLLVLAMGLLMSAGAIEMLYQR
ncbi:sulfite exporter TauE/SafE family protein [endosymbiont of Ridgeia piscesae]|jgi:uncharacterized membrane protein YfcA|uniref:Probable membrane transporter protein n=1 Tax=endosymbiont of Ridgeia piscesae TaxID=54398 RepID=A0A0T5YZ67_9GAMM|nr:sulfite exporter TauE/SafE family protein [endosymbiont of Ridgeia piscesae]KRT55606.1 putative membrane protein YfcA [endosymbiont of Ridgeia piscesae]KRT58251.1 hypothetical protein Ga0076813_13096 [endosymbiont of Ridgeia piscesae]